MNFIIRPVVESDLPKVIEIDHEAFSPYVTTEEPEIFGKRFLAFPDGFIVAEYNGQVVGCGTSERWLTEREPTMNEDPLLTHHAEGKIFCITGMAVRKVFRGQGIGSSLLIRLVSFAREMGCEKIVLETTHAQDFYLRLGFRVVCEKVQWDVKLKIMEFKLQK